MNGKTHIAGGIVLASTLTLTSNLYQPTDVTVVGLTSFALYLSGASLGAILPDVDTRTSTISKKHKVGSFFIRLFLTHRGFTHSLLAFVLYSLLAITLTYIAPIPLNLDKAFIIGSIVGYGSHILLDALNPKGVPLFYPYKKMFRVGNIETGGLLEIGVRLILMLLGAYLIFGKILEGTWTYIENILVK